MNTHSPSAQYAKSKSQQEANPRLLAAQVLSAVIDNGQSLNDALPIALGRVTPRNQGLLQELCYGTLRWYHQLDYLLQQLLSKPFKKRDRDLHALLLSGLYQLLYLRTPSYAAVSETVANARELDKPWAANLVNAVLRNFERQRPRLLAQLEQHFHLLHSHPEWLLKRLQVDWPEHWQAIIAANNQHPPQSLRVNLARISRSDYLQHLHDAGISAVPVRAVNSAITLTQATAVEQLPGFAEGWVSVQDVAAQLAVSLLDLQPGQRVLDACAAPGGKTCHILEHETSINLVALDNNVTRLGRLEQNLTRLQLNAEIITADAGQPEQWWDGDLFDRILLDVPCSATGVIRRHPDIKLLRRENDIAALARYQNQLLEQLWPLLKPGGQLLYATCSVLKQENCDRIRQFLQTHKETQEQSLNDRALNDRDWGISCEYGRQILPGDQSMDGFFYARLHKHGEQHS